MGGITNTTYGETRTPPPHFPSRLFRSLIGFVRVRGTTRALNQSATDCSGVFLGASEEAGDFSPSLKSWIRYFHLIGGTRCDVAGSCFHLQGGKKKSAAS